MTVVVAFDPSVVHTGYAVVDEHDLLDYGTINMPSGVSIPERLSILVQEVEKIIEEHKPEEGVVEQPPPFSYKRSTNWHGKGMNHEDLMKNMSAVAVISATLARLGVRVVELPAHQWKMQRGKNMGKDAVLNLVRAIYPRLRRVRISHHAAEAVLMAHINQGGSNG